MALDGCLSKTPITAKTRAAIIRYLWNREETTLIQPDGFDWDAYFSYYTQQCIQALHHRGRYISARTHKDIIDIARDLEESRNKDDIKQLLRSKLTTPKSADEEEVLLEGSINLATRLLVMMDFGDLPLGFCGRPQLGWHDGSLCLKDVVHGYFNQPQALGHENIKLDKIFTARNLGRIAGIEIVWTDNLADHLRVVGDDDTKVRIFHHASFLKWQQSSIFPDGLIEEALNTLALLFPQSDPKTQKWFESLLNTLPDFVQLDRKLIKCGQLRAEKRQFEGFKFWHDRLVILKQVFDQSRPATLSQWWHDRRNVVQWYTFWVAISVLFLTIFFGLVQSIEGALQVYKSYHPTTGPVVVVVRPPAGTYNYSNRPIPKSQPRIVTPLPSRKLEH
ncbi:hypothetical protein K469DRAFT_745423 [Zopfia rhizophila CBS 207.26]|uniref:Uncharacterized protein n=1 Tax=Zopfia rhizophila CBS 207.26 TaxID=1314779 RepID=A0A6A6EQN4_9PEZI|nr:hypothetical protein K469DRAFT_745423 [Zopfia rhizophila CBS 207.26]